MTLAKVFMLPSATQVNKAGRTKGAHGNRIPATMKTEVLKALWQEADQPSMRLPKGVAKVQAQRAGVSTRTVERWWATERDRRLAQAAQANTDDSTPADTDVNADGSAPTDTDVNADGAAPTDALVNADDAAPTDALVNADGSAPTDTDVNVDGLAPTDTQVFDDQLPAVHPSALLRYDPNRDTSTRFMFTDGEIAWVAGFPTRQAAFDEARAQAEVDPQPVPALVGTRLGTVSRTQFYRSWGEVHPAVRAGLLVGRAAMRSQELHPPRRSAGQYSDHWAIDEYKLKFTVELPSGELIDAKLLIVTQEATMLPRAYSVVLSAANQDDTRRVVGEAARGFTFDGFTVSGSAPWLRHDQGSAFMGAEVRSRLHHMAIAANPVENYSPAANGSAERINALVARHVDRLPGTTRYVLDRTGQPTDTGIIALGALLEAVDDAIHDVRFVDRITVGEFAGFTRFEAQKILTERGDIVPIAVTDEDLAHVAVTLRSAVLAPRTGFGFRNRYYSSPQLAGYGGAAKVFFSTLVDESEVYVFDRDGRYIGPAYPTGEMTDDAKADVYAGRGYRQARVASIVEQHLEDMRQRADETRTFAAQEQPFIEPSDDNEANPPTEETGPPKAATKAKSRKAYKRKPRPERTPELSTEEVTDLMWPADETPDQP